MKITLDYIFDSYKGFNRDENKDQIEVIKRDEYLLFIVFDGISSSENALEAINILREFINKNDERILRSSNFSISELMFQANKHLIETQTNLGYTTFVTAYMSINDDNLNFKICSLGDSRAYLVDKQFLKQLTEDHVVNNSSNIVTKYLGMLEYKREDFKEFVYKADANQRLLLCSDGFYEFIEKPDTKIHEILNFKKIGNIKRSLEKSINLKNQDDASYIFIEFSYV